MSGSREPAPAGHRFGGPARATQLRLAAAALASVLVHLAAARGLAISTLALEPPRSATGAVRQPTNLTAKTPAKTRAKNDAKTVAKTRPATADYRLRSPRTSPSVRPAHEQPLAMAPVEPSSAPSPRDGRDGRPLLAAQAPREIALLERLAHAGEPPSAAPPRPAAPARQSPAASTPSPAANLPAASLSASVATSAAPLPSARGDSSSADSGGLVAAPAATSLLDRMAATAAAARPAPRRGPVPSRLARPSLTAEALGQSDAARASVPAAAEALAIASPAAGPMPAPRVLGRMPGAAIGPASGRSDDAAPQETLSLAEAGLDSLEGADAGGRAAAAIGPPRRKLDRAAMIELPAASRAPEVADAFRRRSRADRAGPGDTPANPARAAARARVERLVDTGLAYLARVQESDGSWSLAGGGPAAEGPQLDSDSAATGLALLAFFGAGHDHFVGEHRDTVRRGIEFLLTTQRADGDLYLPSDRRTDSCAWLYSHAIATMALCEALGMTGDPLVKPAAARACGFIAASREPRLGGWRYLPGTDSDLSVSGWMLVALRSGQLAGLDVDRAALGGVAGLLEAAAGPRPESYSYNPQSRDQRQTAASRSCMTAVGTLMRLHSGTGPSDPRVAAAARVLAASPPTYERGLRDCYLWYYAAQVLVHTGGPEADAWYARLVDVLEPEQSTAERLAGSWDPLGRSPDRWASYGGRLYVTALHLLALETPERRLPTLTAAE